MSATNTSPEWANNAKAKMDSLNLKYKDILHLFDVSTTDAIGHYFNGRREPNIANILSLAVFLNISTEELFLSSEQFQERNRFSNGDSLMDALKILLRQNNVNDQDSICLLNTVDKIGTKNIIEACNLLSAENDNCTSRTDTILNIQAYMSNVG